MSILSFIYSFFFHNYNYYYFYYHHILISFLFYFILFIIIILFLFIIFILGAPHTNTSPINSTRPGTGRAPPPGTGAVRPGTARRPGTTAPGGSIPLSLSPFPFFVILFFPSHYFSLTNFHQVIFSQIKYIFRTIF